VALNTKNQINQILTSQITVFFSFIIAKKNIIFLTGVLGENQQPVASL
jgi:hypothetical protein